MLKLNRKKLGRFIRIISGHNSLFYFRSKVDHEVSPTCRLCLEADETFFHLATECPRLFQAQRDKFLDHLITDDHMWSVQELIDFSYLPAVADALNGEMSFDPEGVPMVDDAESESSSLGEE